MAEHSPIPLTKNNQDANEYLNTAIVENILHGLEGREEKRKTCYSFDGAL